VIIDVIKAITLKAPVAGSMHYETDMTSAANGCPYGDQQIPCGNHGMEVLPLASLEVPRYERK
jgi:hypothetical protein